MHFAQLSGGAFDARNDFVRAGDLIAYEERWNRRIHVQGSVPEGLNLIGATIGNAPRYLWYDLALESDDITFVNAGAAMEFVTPAPAHHGVMLVPDAVLNRHLGEETLASWRRAHVLDAGHPHTAQRLIANIRRIVAHAIAEPQLAADDRYARALEFELMEPLANDYVAPGGGRPGAKGRSRRLRALRRALEYAETLTTPIPIPEFARQLGVGRRTLEYAFGEYLGLSPSRFLRLSRLNKLRAHLAAATPESTTVALAAMEFGFTEPGRLAADYRGMFGENPSTTLRSTQPRPGTTLEAAAREALSSR